MSDQAGGHRPVMVEEVTRLLDVQPGDRILDATLGAGGHAWRLLQQAGEQGELIGLDRDRREMEAAGRRLREAAERSGWSGCRLRLIHGSFGELDRLLGEAGIDRLDRALLDLGVSSMQLDQAARGFSFRREGPLDMRMDPEQEITAADLLNDLPADELAQILKEYGEERYARRIARAIVERRASHRLTGTRDLEEIVWSCYPAAERRGRIHPATRSFQAVRIAVNRELQQIVPALDAVVERLNPGGRLALLTYHSLEDRLVKEQFQFLSGRCRCEARLPICCCGARKLVTLVTRKPLEATAEEVAANPRSRSARLRVVERTAEARRDEPAPPGTTGA